QILQQTNRINDIVQSLMGLANVYLIYSIGRKVFGDLVAVLAAVIALLYGSFMFMDAKLMSTTLGLTLSLSLMRLLLLAGRKQTITLWGANGALLGLTALARPESLLFVPLAVWWIHRVTRQPEAGRKAAPIDQYALAGRQPGFAIAVFVAFTVIVVSPVTLRNWVVTDDWSLSNLISSQAGITFYQANNARGRGLYVFLDKEGFSGNPRTQSEEEKKLAEKATGRSMKRSEVTRYWLGRGLRWILSNPGRYILLETKKLQRFLGSYEYSTEYIIYVERESVRTLWLTSLPFAVITALAIVGILLCSRKRVSAPALLLVLFVIANFLVAMIFYVSSRYRMPSAPYLILFAAAGIEQLWSWFRSPVVSARTEAWAHAGIAVILFVIFHLQVDESARIQQANAHYNAGNEYFTKQLFDEAIAEYDRAVRGDPKNWRAYYNMANTLGNLGRKDEAIAAYAQVLKLNPRMRSARRRIQELRGGP
ncbi:MAG: tetratricopeptide repeat protein, partial [Acidobacteriota bacterium]